jgi:hypothetical protein
LACDFLEDDRVVGLRGIGLEEEREGGLGIETRFSSLGFGEERRGGGRWGRARRASRRSRAGMPRRHAR